MSKGVQVFLRIRVFLDVRKPLKRKKRLCSHLEIVYVSFKYEKLTLFYLFCRRLGHSSSFCQIRMSREEKAVELGWDLSFRAQSRRGTAMSSVWLLENSDERDFGSINGQRDLGIGSGADDQRGLVLRWIQCWVSIWKKVAVIA